MCWTRFGGFGFGLILRWLHSPRFITACDCGTGLEGGRLRSLPLQYRLWSQAHGLSNMRRVELTSRTLLLILLGSALTACGAKPAPEVNWGPRRVRIVEHCPGAEAGYDWGKLRAGIGLWRSKSSDGSAVMDYRMGWMAEGEEGYGVAGLLDGDLDMAASVEVAVFGLKGDLIQLVMVLHRTGGALPESAQAFIRRKMGLAENSRTPVTFADARAAKLGGKKVLFCGEFPEDLPPGKYRVVVELRDQDGKVEQRYEQRLVRREKEQDPLARLSDADAAQQYVKRGEALRGSGVEPIDSPTGRVAWSAPYHSPPSLAWITTHREIVRRGVRMVPALMKMLETEAVRNPGEVTYVTAKFGFAVDVMRMLGEIGDPRSVPLLVRVIDGMDGKANLPVRQEATKTAAKPHLRCLPC